MAKKQGKSLSTNLLDMKFMKKSKEDREKIEEKEKYAQVFESKQVQDDTGVRVTYQPDIAPLEGLLYPRRSYGGQNAAIEKLMAEKDGGGDGSGATQPMETDITDDQMAQHYSSVMGTIGNKFRTKRQRSPSQELAGRGGERTPSRPPVLKKVKEFLRPAEE